MRLFGKIFDVAIKIRDDFDIDTVSGLPLFETLAADVTTKSLFLGRGF
jgi:hypothetical protein